MRREDNIASIEYPVMRTCGNREVNGPIFDLMRLVNWVRREGSDPFTREGINWNNFEAIRWVDHTPPGGLSKRYNYILTNHILKMLQRGTFGAHIPSIDSYDHRIEEGPLDEERYHQNFREAMAEVRYHNFRNAMADLANNDPTHEWVMEYWINHRYDASRDNNFIYERVPAPLHDFIENDSRRRQERLKRFRFLMADYLESRPLHPLENAYWDVHPISHTEDSQELYNHYRLKLDAQLRAMLALQRTMEEEENARIRAQS